MPALSSQAQLFVEMLNEPKNTLGRTEDAVAMVMADPALIEDLYRCYFQPDEWVRLRVSSSFKRLWRADEQLVAPYLEGFVNDVSEIDQPSVSWTIAQLCDELEHLLTIDQRSKAQQKLQGFLERSDDWIVQNSCIQTLGRWATTDATLAAWLKPHLRQLAKSHRKSVARRADTWLAKLA